MPFSHDQCPKKDGGVAENVVRANALKPENPFFKVVIHPSYVNGKDCAVSFQFSNIVGFLEMQLPLTLIFHRSIRKHVAKSSGLYITW